MDGPPAPGGPRRKAWSGWHVDYYQRSLFRRYAFGPRSATANYPRQETGSNAHCAGARQERTDPNPRAQLSGRRRGPSKSVAFVIAWHAKSCSAVCLYGRIRRTLPIAPTVVPYAIRMKERSPFTCGRRVWTIHVGRRGEGKSRRRKSDSPAERDARHGFEAGVIRIRQAETGTEHDTRHGRSFTSSLY